MLKRFLFVLFICTVYVQIFAQSSSPAVRYSELLLFAIRDKQPTEQLLNEIWQYKQEDLQQELNEDKHKKCFWINIYNAFVQLELPKHSDWTTIPKSFFKQKIVKVAGKIYNLATVEKKMLGTGEDGLKNWDYRLLFTLNKGAVGSPDIVVHDSETVEVSLDIATKTYLKREVHMDEEGFEAEVPMVFKKRRNDFGGKEKVIEILRLNEVIYMNVLPKLEYKAFDWKVKLANFLPTDTLRR
jgi:hypothetical protein